MSASQALGTRAFAADNALRVHTNSIVRQNPGELSQAIYQGLRSLVSTIQKMRDLASSLLGHWVIKRKKLEIHYYIDNNSILMIDASRRMPMAYTVLASSSDGRNLRVNVTTPFDKGHDKYLQITPDGRSIVETIGVLGTSVTTRWEYVDSNTKDQ